MRRTFIINMRFIGHSVDAVYSASEKRPVLMNMEPLVFDHLLHQALFIIKLMSNSFALILMKNAFWSPAHHKWEADCSQYFPK